MTIKARQTRLPADALTRRLLRRASAAVAVLAVVAAAMGLPVTLPAPVSGPSPIMAIARADCPPDCGSGPGNGGTPSGPAGGGTEFVPPAMPEMPPYEAGRGYPAPDQNNGISIYNSNAPQPSRAAQPSQAPIQNQDGNYNRAANGEQQPINYNNAPSNQQISNDWQKLSEQLNNPQEQQTQQPGEDGDQQNQADESDQSDTCSVEDIPALVSGVFSGGMGASALAVQKVPFSGRSTAECGNISESNSEASQSIKKASPKEDTRSCNDIPLDGRTVQVKLSPGSTPGSSVTARWDDGVVQWSVEYTQPRPASRTWWNAMVPGQTLSVSHSFTNTLGQSRIDYSVTALLTVCQGTPPPSKGPGSWVQDVNEAMSQSAREYQERITGHPSTDSYQVRDNSPSGFTKFDDFKNGRLVDAKDHYESFINSQGELVDFMARDFLKRAERQTLAANGTPILWSFHEQRTAQLVEALLYPKYPNIEVLWEP